MDAGGQGKIVLSKSFLESSNDFFWTLANTIKEIYTKKQTPQF